MVSSRFAALALIGTLVGSAVAQFEIFAPGGPDVWWVAQSQNTMAWTCRTDPPASTNNAFQLLLNNSSPSILTSVQAIIASVPNADCSLTVTPQQAALTPATGYTLIFADPIYAVSQPFEVKALGAAYPTSTSSPAGTATSQSGSASNTGTSTGSSASSTSTSKSNGALASFKFSAAGVLAAVGAAVGML